MCELGRCYYATASEIYSLDSAHVQLPRGAGFSRTLPVRLCNNDFTTGGQCAWQHIEKKQAYRLRRLMFCYSKQIVQT